MTTREAIEKVLNEEQLATLYLSDTEILKLACLECFLTVPYYREHFSVLREAYKQLKDNGRITALDKDLYYKED